MQTVTLKIKDSFMPVFEQYLDKHIDNFEIVRDKNLELDPYFYERKKELSQDLKDIENGKMKMYDEDEFNETINDFFLKLEKNKNN